jgi:hypothetical protein
MAGSAYVRLACACVRRGVRVRHISFISVGLARNGVNRCGPGEYGIKTSDWHGMGSTAVAQGRTAKRMRRRKRKHSLHPYRYRLWRKGEKWPQLRQDGPTETIISKPYPYRCKLKGGKERARNGSRSGSFRDVAVSQINILGTLTRFAVITRATAQVDTEVGLPPWPRGVRD